LISAIKIVGKKNLTGDVMSGVKHTVFSKEKLYYIQINLQNTLMLVLVKPITGFGKEYF